MTGEAGDETPHPLKQRPAMARQHATAGPYSPVLEIDARRLVVISGQVAVDLYGRTLGDTIELDEVDAVKAPTRAHQARLDP